ncbi:hypothetical protein SNE40_020789 [Patella caerulea]|uniref:Uncharacterized protein n=1 Tax=Patella caerulea TaxID=87958 RepID=A0AAN8J5V5_PATCE
MSNTTVSKRGRDSEGETPKRESKTNRMEDDITDSRQPRSLDFISEQIEVVMKNMAEMCEKQDSMRKMFED